MEDIGDFDFKKESNWQIPMIRALDGERSIRQNNPENYKHGVAGFWGVLWPIFKKKLSKRIGDGERNEKYFDELMEEVETIDMADELENATAREKEIRSCEYIRNTILEVLQDSKMLHGGSSQIVGITSEE